MRDQTVLGHRVGECFLQLESPWSVVTAEPQKRTGNPPSLTGQTRMLHRTLAATKTLCRGRNGSWYVGVTKFPEHCWNACQCKAKDTNPLSSMMHW